MTPAEKHTTTSTDQIVSLLLFAPNEVYPMPLLEMVVSLVLAYQVQHHYLYNFAKSKESQLVNGHENKGKGSE
jgi:hypothetical protein